MLLYEMLAGKSPFDIGGHDMPDQSTEDYLFQGTVKLHTYVGYDSLRGYSFLLSHDILCLQAHPHYSCILVLLCAAVILEKTIRIPRSLSVKAAQVLKGFLNKVYNNTYIWGLSHDWVGFKT